MAAVVVAAAAVGGILGHAAGGWRDAKGRHRSAVPPPCVRVCVTSQLSARPLGGGGVHPLHSFKRGPRAAYTAQPAPKQAGPMEMGRETDSRDVRVIVTSHVHGMSAVTSSHLEDEPQLRRKAAQCTYLRNYAYDATVSFTV